MLRSRSFVFSCCVSSWTLVDMPLDERISLNRIDGCKHDATSATCRNWPNDRFARMRCCIKSLICFVYAIAAGTAPGGSMISHQDDGKPFTGRIKQGIILYLMCASSLCSGMDVSNQTIANWRRQIPPIFTKCCCRARSIQCGTRTGMSIMPRGSWDPRFWSSKFCESTTKIRSKIVCAVT